MLRSVQDVAYPSGGVVAGLGNSAFQQIPNIEGIDATVIDNRAANSTALGVGKLFVEQFLAANSGDLKKEIYIPSTVNDILVAGQGKVKMLKSNDPWFGVTYRQDHAHVVESVKRLIAKGTYPERLWA